jgi:leucine efflux protein
MISTGIISYWAFVLGTILTAIVPGANTYRVLDFSYKHGPVGGIWSSLGVVLADLTFMVAAALGLASLLTIFPSLYSALLLFGALYFLRMAISVLRSPKPENHKFERANESKRIELKEKISIFSNSYLTCASNFKAVFFYTLFFPKFIDPTFSPTWLPFLLLCSTVLAILVIYYSILSLTGIWLFTSEKGRHIFTYVTLAFGVFIGILALKLFQEFYLYLSVRFNF